VTDLSDVFDEGFLVAGVFGGGRALEHLAGLHALVLEAGQAPGEHGLADQRDGHAVVERRNGRPLAGALLAGRVSDLLHQERAVLVLVLEDVFGDLDQEGVQLALVPFFKHLKFTSLFFCYKQLKI
jgi:hypothetical protein